MSNFFKTKDELEMEKKPGRIPQFERVLSNAANFISRKAAEGTPIGTVATLPITEIPKVGFQTVQGLVGDFPQNVLESPGSYALGGAPGVQFASGQQVGIGLRNLLEAGIRGILGRFRTELGEFQPREVQGEKGPLASLGQSLSKAFLEPKTPKGKIIGTIGNIASGAFPLMPGGARATARGLARVGEKVAKTERAFNIFDIRKQIARQSAETLLRKRGVESKLIPEIEKLAGKQTRTQARLGSLKERLGLQAEKRTAEISQRQKALEQSISKEISDIRFETPRQVQKKLKTRFREANEIYGRELEGISQTRSVSGDDLIEVVDNTVKDLGLEGRLELTRSERFFENLSKKLSGVAEEGTERAEEISGVAGASGSITDLKAFVKNVRRAIPVNDHTLTVFYKHLGDKISDVVPELNQLNKGHRRIYKLAKNSKLLGKETIGKIAKGTAGRRELKVAEAVERQLGTTIVRKARGISEKSRRIADDFGLRAEDVESLGQKKVERLEQVLGKRKERVSQLKDDLRSQIKRISDEAILKGAVLGVEQQNRIRRLITLGAISAIAGGARISAIVRKRF